MTEEANVEIQEEVEVKENRLVKHFKQNAKTYLVGGLGLLTIGLITNRYGEMVSQVETQSLYRGIKIGNDGAWDWIVEHVKKGELTIEDLGITNEKFKENVKWVAERATKED